MSFRFVTQPEIRREARRILPLEVWNFGDGASETELTKKRNRQALDRLRGNVFVGEIGAPGKRDWEAFLPVTNDKKRGIPTFLWQEDSQHILYIQDEGGDEDTASEADAPSLAAPRRLSAGPPRPHEPGRDRAGNRIHQARQDRCGAGYFHHHLVMAEPGLHKSLVQM